MFLQPPLLAMSALDTLAWIGVALAGIPAAMTLWNIGLYRRSPRPGRDSGVARDANSAPRAAVSLLIPARNEESGIEACLEAALANREVELEVLVLDDGSTDRTAERVRAIASRDPRVRLEAAPPLPPGWCGKQAACRALAALASHETLVFLDADVRLAPDAIGRIERLLAGSRASLVSGFPRQVTGSTLEHALLPLMTFLLLGYLPIFRMRRSTSPAYGAGCGQLFATRRASYQAAGTHEAIRASRHDGLALPRAYRRAGLLTDVFDASDIASCRMYHGARETWEGLAKNATEGLADPRAILPWTLLLLGGATWPAALGFFWWLGAPLSPLPVGLGLALSYLPRLLATIRFRQSIPGAALHPLGVLLLVAVQWHALVRAWRGRPSVWRGRAYDGAGTAI